ncbi:MarR family winged helix-turn-helix transcriptional regulator [Tomitella biformata]|uniref:MarR family winged helix-turn-helix transcriptional regulator n=1 Tax=Tomitella biformata TaxID=630403 RepID=UPI0006867496|nr:MarR family transcriptional regulator [Tomitella biformata]
MTVARQVRRRQMHALEPMGINPSQARALRALARAGHPLRSGELAERLRIQARSGTDVIDGLEAGGLVRREPDPADRRAVQVELTPAGVELAKQIGAAQRSASAEFFAVLPATEQEALRSLLDHLTEECQ